MFSFMIAIFGSGIGGEYSNASASAAEKAEEYR